MADLSNTAFSVIDEIVAAAEGKKRFMVAITGAPGSGKSTLSAEILRRMQQKKLEAVVVPMDGFHLDNGILDEMGMRARKGSPETFDAHGFIHAMKRIREGQEIFLPVFDRTRDLSIAGALHVPAACPIVIVEGNYLMFDEDPWRQLADVWDMTIRWDVPLPELRARLIQRWLNHNLPRTVALRRAEGNDIPNAQRIISKTLPCDIVLDGTPAR